MTRMGALLLAGLLAVQAEEAGAAVTPKPVPKASTADAPYRYTGLIGAGGYQGSGAVIGNKKVVLSCAHLVYEEMYLDPWITDAVWYRAYQGQGYPAGKGQRFRGYYHFSSYQQRGLKWGFNDERTFAADFTAHFAYADLSGGVGPGPMLENGVSALKSSKSKLITGYPAGLYRGDNPLQYRMHATGPFTKPLEVFAPGYPYMEAFGVSTGPGNSGGPVWVWDGGAYRFTGVLVAGLESSKGGGVDLIGVKAMDSDAAALYRKAVMGTVDTTPPLLVFSPVFPKNGSVSVTFAGKASDDRLLQSVQFRSRRASGTYAAWKAAALSGASSRVKSWKATVVMPAHENYVVQFRAYDGINYSAPVHRTVKH
jgi:hypothetical protein